MSEGGQEATKGPNESNTKRLQEQKNVTNAGMMAKTCPDTIQTKAFRKLGFRLHRTIYKSSASWSRRVVWCARRVSEFQEVSVLAQRYLL
jgi:hypothetical protein